VTNRDKIHNFLCMRETSIYCILDRGNTSSRKHMLDSHPTNHYNLHESVL